MKAIKAQIKTISLILSVLVVFQSCTVYKSTNVTLNEAVNLEIRARVKTNDNQTLKFKKIEFKDGQFYGVKKTKGELITIQINEQELKRVQVENRKMSSFLSIALPIIATAGVIGVIELISFANNFCMWNCN